ncbi:MAG TPA: YceI family protein [Burkholderiales bacterium]|nr:YceI family protein [Burkholderiales bacterium]
MKPALIALSLTALISAGAWAADDTYTIDPNHTYPMFAVNHLGFTTQHGRFDKTSGTVKLDRTAKTGSVDLVIDTRSLDMGSPLWNEHLSGDGFFNTAKFPTMTYKSDKLVFNGDKVVGAQGEFTLLGVTKPLHVSVTGFHCGINPLNQKALCGGNVSAHFKRSEFGMTKFLPLVGDEVEITVPVEAYKD